MLMCHKEANHQIKLARKHTHVLCLFPSQWQLFWHNHVNGYFSSLSWLVSSLCGLVSCQLFATGGPMLWNSLPEQLRQLDITFGQFKRSLKTFMFG